MSGVIVSLVLKACIVCGKFPETPKPMPSRIAILSPLSSTVRNPNYLERLL